MGWLNDNCFLPVREGDGIPFGDVTIGGGLHVNGSYPLRTSVLIGCERALLCEGGTRADWVGLRCCFQVAAFVPGFNTCGAVDCEE